ncbi:MAG: hypothetical protein PHF31_12190 [Methylobacter sp.]|nr:hypothetical protein [Methylobacter sp.]
MSNLQLQQLIKEISRNQFTGYLKNKGWIIDGKIGDQAIIWHRPEESNYENEIIQPTTKATRGFTQRIKEAIDTLVEFEKRNAIRIVEDILNLYADLVKIRVVHTDVEGGTIPLDDGVLLVEKARELLVASTLSTFKKQRYFSGNRSKEAQDYLEQLRLGQTEIGSFVISLISPIQIQSQNQNDANQTSLTRSVTTNLARSLNAISNAINKYAETGDIFHFEEVVLCGVSANLCDALIGLSGSSKARNFVISIQAAGAECENQDISTQHSFTPLQVPVLERASEYYKGNFVINGYVVSGVVTGMKHQPEDDFGMITVNSLVNSSGKNISVQLCMEDYWKAVHAHESGAYVACTGDLLVANRSARLIEPRDFKVNINHGLFDDKT